MNDNEILDISSIVFVNKERILTKKGRFLAYFSRNSHGALIGFQVSALL
jgi:hypothetical protein